MGLRAAWDLDKKLECEFTSEMDIVGHIRHSNIVHRDVKSSTILLNSVLNAKVTDVQSKVDEDELFKARLPAGEQRRHLVQRCRGRAQLHQRRAP